MKRTRLRYLLCVCLFVAGTQRAQAQDPSFGDDGFAFAGFNDLLLNFSSVTGIAIQADGKIVVLGHARRSGGDFSDTAYVVARFNTNGTLDTTFGNIGGRVAIGFNDLDFPADLAILPDGKILIGGSTAASGSPTTSIALARLTTAGALDLTFGASGRVIRSIGSGVSISAMKVLSDGRILFAGTVARSGTGNDFLLIRLRSTGALDTSFGARGLFPNLSASVSTDFGGDERASAMAIYSDGRIAVVGTTQVGADSRFAVARYNANGFLDNTFGGNGRVTTNFVSGDHGGSSGDAALGVAIQGDGKIVAVGRAETDTGLARTDFAVARYNTDGTLDTSFGGDGRVTTAFTPGDPARANEAAFTVLIQPNGRIIAAGFTGVPFNEVFGIIRYNADGTLDASFDGDGKITTDDRGRIVFASTFAGSFFSVSFIVAGQGNPPGATTRMTAAKFFAFFRELTIVGAFDLGPSDATIDVHQRLNYTFSWTVPEPQNWHDLKTLDLRIRDGSDTILWVRFDEATSSFSLFNEAAGRFGPAAPAGSRHALQTRDAALELSETTVVGSGPTGPHVTLKLALSFKPRAAGRTFTVEVAAVDDNGVQAAFVEAGTLTVRR